MAPLDLSTVSVASSWLIFGALGFAFGFVLEWAGFGDTRKLAGQFYLTEMTVLKVMFTAIVVAAVLVFGATSLQLLDLSRVWMNPTYLWPGIVGGLIMGLGFVVGGFCPGTSLVAAATLKVDGIFFVLGALVGVGLFGGTVASFESWWLSSFYGTYTLPEWLDATVGVTLVGVIAMALGAFWFAGWVERRGGQLPVGTVPLPTWMPWARRAGAGLLFTAALLVALRGQPTSEQKWQRSPAATRQLVSERALFVDPAEVVALKQDTGLRVEVLDLRDEHDFNLFHVGGSRRLEPRALERVGELKALVAQPASTVTFLVGNGEAEALQAWQRLKGEGVPNLYVIEGGINGWLDAYPPPPCVAARATPGLAVADAAAEALAWRFAYAAGAQLPSAWPELPPAGDLPLGCDSAAPEGGEEKGWPPRTFTKKVRLQTKTLVKGGCG